jgi:hypothetical protein
MLSAKVNPKYEAVVAKTGSMIHRLTGEATVTWLPRNHEPGFISSWFIHSSGTYSSGDITYKVHCKSPGYVRNGILLTEEQANSLPLDRSSLNAYLGNPPPSQRQSLAFCHRCYPERYNQ